MAKTSKTYRLSDDGLAALDKIAKRLGLNHTATIEFVMRQLASHVPPKFSRKSLEAAMRFGNSPGLKAFLDGMKSERLKRDAQQIIENVQAKRKPRKEKT